MNEDAVPKIITNYRYRISAKFHIKNDKGEVLTTVEPKLYNQLTVVKDYFNSFLPIIKLSCKIDTQGVHWFSKYERNVTCSLAVTEELSGDETFSNVQSRKVIDDIYVVYFDRSKFPRMFETSTKVVDSSKPTEDPDTMVFTEDNMAAANTFVVNCVMWQLDSLKAKKLMYNSILTNSEEEIGLPEAMVYISNKNKYVNEYLYDIPENTTKYRQIILLPYNLPNTVTSLQTRYGIYENGIISFYDHGRFYLLKKYSSDHVVPKDQLKDIRINLTENEPRLTQNTSVYRTDTYEQYNRNYVISPTENRPALSEIFGDIILFSNLSTITTSSQFKEDAIDFESPIREIENSKSSHRESGVKITPEYDEINNPFIMNEYVRSANNFPITVQLNSVRYGNFEPYKTVTVSTNNKQSNDRFGGQYQVGSVIYTIRFDNIADRNRVAECGAILSLVSPKAIYDGMESAADTSLSKTVVE